MSETREEIIARIQRIAREHQGLATKVVLPAPIVEDKAMVVSPQMPLIVVKKEKKKSEPIVFEKYVHVLGDKRLRFTAPPNVKKRLRYGRKVRLEIKVF